jgi:hypothetical protein
VNIDDLIRESVQRQEELAVDPDRVRVALPALAARRQRARTRVMLATVAAGVAVAVAVPVIILRDTGTVVSATAPQATMPLQYRPTWLPDGMVEEFRGNSYVGSGLARSWVSRAPESADRSNPNVLLSVRPTSPENVDREPNVDINGVPGSYGEGSVIWEVGDTRFVVAGRFPEEDMLRIARSVEPDPTQMRLPLQFNWLPDGSAEWTRKSGDPSVKVTGFSPTEYEAAVLVYDSQSYLQAFLGTRDVAHPDAASHGETVIVNGRTALLAQGGDGDPDPTGLHMRTDWVLSMDLGDGRHLTLHGGTSPEAPPMSRDDVIRVAENIQFDPDPDVGWLGQR